MSKVASVWGQVEATALRATLGLPARFKRVLAGRPIVLDGQTLALDAQLTLRLQRLVREPGAETLPLAKGRAAMTHHAKIAGGTQPIGSTRDLDVAGLPARLYVPTGLGEGEEAPLVVFFHGGGFMFGDLDSHDAPCRVLAQTAGVRLIAIDYRLAPEHPFPAAYDDCVAAYAWIVEHAEQFHATTFAVAGDSAGGNLAAGVAVAAAQRGLPCAFQLLIYPTADAHHDTESFRLFGRDFYLTGEFMTLARSRYAGETDLTDPRLSPMFAEVPDGLAPAYIATAGFDPLRDEGESYARKLAAAGVKVELRRFTGQIHGFFNITGVGVDAPQAVAEIGAALRAGVR